MEEHRRHATGLEHDLPAGGRRLQHGGDRFWVLAAFASRTTAPSRLTTQMWVSFIETSNPA
jgi:hypothetical protein